MDKIRENSRHCAICKKTSEETTLYRGVLKTRIVDVCADCAEDQKIPIIKMPSQSQLKQMDKTYSVRERLDRMSGRYTREGLRGERLATQRNLAKLRMPKPKQNHPDVLDNYYWTLSMARRRNKMTTSQLAKKAATTASIIQGIERGTIPEDFKEIFSRLESIFNIKLLKNRHAKINFIRKDPNKDAELLKAVKEKMDRGSSNEDVKKEVEAVKLSDEKMPEDVTLSDLIDRKRAREKHNLKAKQEEMFGDDISFDEM